MHFSTHAQQRTTIFLHFCCTFLLARNRAPRFLCTSVALFYSRATEHAFFQHLLLHFSTRMQQRTRFFCTSVALFYSRATENTFFQHLLLHFSTRAQQSTRFSSIFCCTFLLARNRARVFPASSVALIYSRATEHHDFSSLLLHFSTRAQQSTTISLHFSTRAQQRTNHTTAFCCK